MGSNIMKNCCWVIKVTFLKTGEVNFNEAYWTLARCKAAIGKKITNDIDIEIIDEYTIKDLDNDIIYEAKLVDIFE